RLTFAQLAERVEPSTRAAMAAGVEPGDRVAIWAPNVWEWIVAALGALGAGGVLVPINTRFKGGEAGYVLEKSGAKVLLTVNGFLGFDYVGMLRTAMPGDSGGAGTGPVPGLPALEKIVVLRGDAPEGTETWEHYLEAGGAIDPADAAARTAAVRPEDLSDIIFTSGTTGRPKGVMVTHAQTLRVFETWSSFVGLTEGDRYLVVMPFFHTFGYKAGWMAALMRGATTVPQAVFDVDEVLRNVEKERISMLPGAPTLYMAILEHPDRAQYDLSSLRLAVTGAAAVPVEMIKRMRTELTFETILTAYGLTECTGTATICRPEDDPETIANTSGRAIPDVEVLVVDDDGHEVPRGEPGEVVVRGYNVMLGYFEDAEQTAETIDADGWLHTGDIGVMDERGYLDITDRKKDMIIRGGENIYPAEVENLLLGHGGIAQAAVVGVPDERFGEVVMAYVISRAGADVDPAEVIEWARANMANYKVPKFVEVVDELPLNASGKVLKFELRERASAAYGENRE
ncbi:MAG TPA: FadD3 family acyl-CoA ligase, partial [Acidimicrobiales bacterium]|nr:FadD3 family acyl-CoA ligase [Acidimicrobiales bacterium]